MSLIKVKMNPKKGNLKDGISKMILDLIYFLLRYAPFWAIPMTMIGLEFAYIFWLKNFRLVPLVMSAASGLCIIVTGFYYWAGGPDKIVPAFNDVLRFLS